MHSVARDYWQPFKADIIVYDPTGTKTELLVEVERDFPDIQAAEKLLRESMLQANCHNGLLVTPEWMFVYRDTFKSSDLDAIVQTGKLPTAQILEAFIQGRNLDDERQLTQVVATWLQALSENWFDWLATIPNDDDIINALLPEFVGAVAQGRIVSETGSYGG